jgi:hypothetical protein
LSKIDQLTDEQPYDEKGARRYVACAACHRQLLADSPTLRTPW